MHQVDVDEMIAGLPELEPLEETHLQWPGRRRILLAAAGFEDRARTPVKQFPANTWDDVVLVRYPTNELDNEPTLQTFRDIAINGERSEILYARGTLWQELHRVLNRYGDGDGCVAIVDVSGMSSYVFYPVLQAVIRAMARACL